MSTAPWRRMVRVCTAAMLTIVLLFLSDTARIGRGAESMKLSSVRLSARLSVPSIDSSNGRRRVCC